MSELERAQIRTRPRPLSLADHGAFFVAGLPEEHSDTMNGQMFVEYKVPVLRIHSAPVVMIHGGGQTGACFLDTPDGRPGWFEAFVRGGFAVYVVDLPGWGRAQGQSARAADHPRTASAVRSRVSLTGEAGTWPQARYHTQWPDSSGAFPTFYASQVSSPGDGAENEALARTACDALLDRIGPSVLLTHSQGGAVGWGVANDCPDLVKGIVALEPNGPPVHDIVFMNPPVLFQDGLRSRPWGITRTPLNYDPPVSVSAELNFVQQDKPDGPLLACCWMQEEPARSLPRLQRVPIVIVSGEASYHAPYDHGTSAFLTQAGVSHDFLRLADHGIRGNGHMIMLEKNNLEVAGVLQDWILRNVPG